MFTGIVEEIGIVKGINSGQLIVSAKKVLEGIMAGDSIAVNGVCLTATSVKDSCIFLDIMPETIRLTNIGRLHYGNRVNLERALLACGRIGGHFVQGHVDDTGKVLSVTPEANAVIVRIAAPGGVMHYIVNKGFVAVDGVSLTVITYDDFSFSVSLVSYSRENTILSEIKPGDMVNLEVDIIAKYVERLKQKEDNKVISDFLLGQTIS